MALELTRSWLAHLVLDQYPYQLGDSIESSRVQLSGHHRSYGPDSPGVVGVVTAYRKTSASGQNARLGLSSHEEAGDI